MWRKKRYSEEKVDTSYVKVIANSYVNTVFDASKLMPHQKYILSNIVLSMKYH